MSKVLHKFAGALERDRELRLKVRQLARIAGIKPNGTDYSKPESARGRNSTVACETRGDLANVRFTARWRKGFDVGKFKAAAIHREDKAMRMHFPYMLDTEGGWRKPRKLSDGRIVYGRDKVGSDVLIARWRAEEIAKQDKVDADARRVREIELAELMRLQSLDEIAAGRGKLGPCDKAETALSLALQAAGIR